MSMQFSIQHTVICQEVVTVAAMSKSGGFRYYKKKKINHQLNHLSKTIYLRLQFTELVF